jgi:hypothetical protein
LEGNGPLSWFLRGSSVENKISRAFPLKVYDQSCGRGEWLQAEIQTPMII